MKKCPYFVRVWNTYQEWNPTEVKASLTVPHTRLSWKHSLLLKKENKLKRKQKTPELYYTIDIVSMGVGFRTTQNNQFFP